MSNQYLKLRRSGVPGKIPSTSSIDYGEIALNTHDGKAYMKISGSNGIQVVQIGAPSGSFSGSFTGTFSGSLYGTASWAENYNETDPIFTAVSGTFTTTASFNAFTSSYYNDSASFDTRIINNSSSIALLSSSFTSFSSSYNTGSFTGQFSGSFSGSGANLFGIPASGIVGLNLSQISSGSYSASISEAGLLVNNRVVADSFTGSLFGTASWADNAITSSYALNATSASYALSASYAESSSYALDATSASYAFSSSYALSASQALTASHVNTLNQNVTIVGNQTISGSLTVRENLVVLGSASVTYISESTLNIGTNLITVNTFDPGARFGGLAVIDSGSSPLVSASFLYDSVQDEFIFVHRGTAAGAITSSHFVLGPETYNDLGNETYLTLNRIPKGTGIEHLNDSNIYDDGNVIKTISGSNDIGLKLDFANSIYLLGQLTGGNLTQLTIDDPTNTVSISGSTVITGSLVVTAGVSGSFSGSGANLSGIPASGIVGLNLSQISSGSVSASISPNNGLQVNIGVTAPSFTGSLFGTASFATTASFALNIDDGFY